MEFFIYVPNNVQVEERLRLKNFNAFSLPQSLHCNITGIATRTLFYLLNVSLAAVVVSQKET